MFFANLKLARGLAAALVLVVAALDLAGCKTSGGGGSSSDDVLARPDPGPLAPPQPAATFETAEFNANWGLDKIQAQSVYAEGAYGDGVTVAVIDSGIDTGHADLVGNISPLSIDIVDPTAPLVDNDGHGTAVAGVIAARKNGVASHGVAFESSIMAIRADDHCGSPPCSLFDSDIASAVNYAVGNLAHVINMSLGGTFPNSAELDTALGLAANAGVIMVASAGNSGGSQPEFPAAGAGSPLFDGLMLAVGSVGQTDTISAFSNRCGSSQDFCLVAPGENIITTAAGGGTASATGTSFSAPHVSGAAALLIQRFPNLSAQQVVQILLQSATDLGTPGVDSVYGHGLLNLDAAVGPLGTLSVPLSATAAGSSAPVDDTRLELGPAFGDALSNIGILRQAIALDDFDRPYPVDLGDAVTVTERSFGLRSLLALDTAQDVRLPGPDGFAMTMSLSQAEAMRSFSDRVQSDYRFESLNFSTDLTDRSAVRMGYRTSSGSHLNGQALAAGASGLFWQSGETLSPHHALLGTGSAMSFSTRVGEATTLSVGWFQEGALEGLDLAGTWDDSGIGQVTLSHRFTGGPNLQVGMAMLDEADSFLGSETDGAFGSGSDAQSLFLNVGAAWPIGETFELLGSFTMAATDMGSAGDSMLSDWGTVQANAFGAGAVAKNVLRDGDRLGFLAGQPLRVTKADARLTVPVSLDADENVSRESERVDVTPSGREIDFQLAYDTPLQPGMTLSSWLMMQVEPGHDAGADPAYGVGMKFRMSF